MAQLQFDLSLADDHLITGSFLESLEPFFDDLIYGRFNLREYIQAKENDFSGFFENISSSISGAWEEAKVKLRQAKSIFYQYRDDFFDKLPSIGFSGENLKIKAKLLNYFSNMLEEAISKFSPSAEFLILYIEKINYCLKKLLGFLNKLLDSMKLMFHFSASGASLEPLKELKDFVEEFLD